MPVSRSGGECITDEHYMPTVLAYAGAGEDTTCNPNPVMEVNWRQACCLLCKATYRLHISAEIFSPSCISIEIKLSLAICSAALCCCRASAELLRLS